MKPRPTVRMLLRLYPRAWRERYADEMSAMLSDVSLTPASILDIVAGAIDARVAPQAIRGNGPAAQPEREQSMFTTMMTCCATGPGVTPQDRWLGSTVMIGLSAVFAAAYIVAASMFRGSDLVDALGIMAFPAAMFLSMPFTYLKGHSRTSQVVIVGGCLLVLIGASLVAVWI